MNEFIVNLDHTTRQQVTVLAATAEDAALLVHGMFCNSNALDYLPTVSTNCVISCNDVALVSPTIYHAPFEDDDYVDDEEDEDWDETEVDYHQFCNARDEVEAALEHLQYALSHPDL